MSIYNGRKKWLSLSGAAALLSLAIFISFSFTRYSAEEAPEKKLPAAPAPNLSAQLYDSLHLENTGLSREAYIAGTTGLQHLIAEGKLHNDSLISIVDFTLPSNKKRLFVLNAKTGRVLFKTYVSHGKNSGEKNATSFSNEFNSYKSSLGFYITGNTYKGAHGYSLKLMGEEDGINDNAFERGIVMHSAWYVNEKLARRQGYIGRSEGCPAIPVNIYKKVISTIKEGSCLFMYSNDKTYTEASQLIRPEVS